MPEASPTGAAYMTLTNQGKSDDRLLAASSPRAQSAELHTHLNDHGVMRMRPVADGIALLSRATGQTGSGWPAHHADGPETAAQGW
ncbi:copper chaperone PCu(A)C [Paludibacterium denitrificans]|uniref:copper chaperone PCu(A)C n=1 Tax=Paludibacterium denitrificans TaxID=2675226 RepID=UPI002478087E|nr:copper chaperone PCu(A)C [Paludibacterium denitrificans]